MKKILIFLGISCLLFGEIEKKQVNMVIYNQNFAVVEEIREGTIDEGRVKIKITDIPKFLEPSSVNIFSINFPSDFLILDQTFDYDILSPDKLLEKNIGKKVEVITKDGQSYSGTLLNFTSQILTIETKNKILILNRENLREISMDKISGFIYKPELNFLVENKKKAKHILSLKYITSNINWNANYLGIYREDENKIDLNGWITIDNRSGIDYKNVNLTLIAGQIKKIAERDFGMNRAADAYKAREMVAALAPRPMPEETPFFEYHMYKLPESVDIENEKMKQVSFLNKVDIPVIKKYVYDGATYRYYHYDNWRRLPYNDKVNILIEFKNEGKVLPSGKMKVYKQEKQDTIFIGEDMIPHTPIGEKVKLSIGNAFDIKGERKIMAHERISQNVYKDTYEIKVKNFKNQDVEVEIIEHLYGSWEIIEKTHDFEKIDAYTIKFPVKIPGQGEVTVKYTAVTKF